MNLEGTMRMDTGIWWLDWFHDVWPLDANATMDGLMIVLVLAFIACWWGIWERSFN